MSSSAGRRTFSVVALSDHATGTLKADSRKAQIELAYRVGNHIEFTNVGFMPVAASLQVWSTDAEARSHSRVPPPTTTRQAIEVDDVE
jgi:hypothetical protein